MTEIDEPDETADWSIVASGWDKHRDRVEDFKSGLTARLLDVLALQPGERVLELGAGTGELSRRLADAVGPDGHVLTSDIAAGMVDLIRTTTADLPQVTVTLLNAADTKLPDSDFDAAAIRMGLMLVPEPEQALREVLRVLRPSGRLAAATWAGPEHNPWLITFGIAGMIHGLLSGGPPVGPGGVFSLADPEKLRQLALDAGFADASVESIDAQFAFADVDDYIDHVSSLAAPFAAAYGAATQETRDAVRATVETSVAVYRDESGALSLPARSLLLSATK